MPGAEEFVRGSRVGRSTVPTESLRKDRAAAKDLKIPMGEVRPDTAPSNTDANQTRSRRLQSDHNSEDAVNVFDDTVTSGLESNDGHIMDEFNDGPDVGEEAFHAGAYRARSSKIGQSRVVATLPSAGRPRTPPSTMHDRVTQLVDTRTAQSPRKLAQIAGRFQDNVSRGYQGHLDGYSHVNANDKRARSTEGSLFTSKLDARPHEKEHLERLDRDRVSLEHIDIEPARSLHESSRRLSNITSYTEEIPNEDQQSQCLEDPIVRDHDDITLSKMSYEQLCNEEFDKHPAENTDVVPADLQDPTTSIADRMVRCLAIAKTTEENLDPVLEVYFSQLSKVEWEAAGDWLIDRFATLLKDFKDARRQKRQLVEHYEAKIQAREQAVRDKSQALDLEMNQMKEKGMKVVCGGKRR